MNKNVTIAVIAGIVIIVGVIGYQFYETSWQRTSTDDYYQQGCEEGCDVAHVVYPENPQSLYGLSINKDKYLLGENVYVTITEIPMGLKTQAIFYTPSRKQFYEIKIDGDKTSGFKQYFKPQLLKNRDLCDVDDLIGTWMVLFENNPGEKMYFEFTGEYLPDTEKYYDPLTCGYSKTVPLQPDYIQPLD